MSIRTQIRSIKRLRVYTTGLHSDYKSVFIGVLFCFKPHVCVRKTNRNKQELYQVLSHIHCDHCYFLIVFADHLLDDTREVVVLSLFDDVQQLLHHGPDEGPYVDLSYTHTEHF